MKKDISYCGQLVKEHDPDRFLISMLMRPESREALWALFAFNHEIAKTREVVSETQLGHIRLQWWRDAIAGIYDGGEVLEHEVIKPLAEAIRAHDLPREYFDSLLHAREFDLEDMAPAHLEGLLIYADHTQTPLMKLAVQMTGDDPELEPVQPVAINYALAGILRAVPFHKAQGRSYLPVDLMAANGLTLQKLPASDLSSSTYSELCEIIEKVMVERVVGLRPKSRFLRASDHLAQMYFNQIKKHKFNLFAPKMAVPPAFKELRLLVASLR